jgi:hypothetical protein
MGRLLIDTYEDSRNYVPRKTSYYAPFPSFLDAGTMASYLGSSSSATILTLTLPTVSIDAPASVCYVNASTIRGENWTLFPKS